MARRSSRSSSSRSRSRRSRSSSSTQTVQQVTSTTTQTQAAASTTSTTVSTASTTTTSSRSRRSYTSSRRRYTETDTWVERHLDELIEKLGIDFLGLSREEYMSILTKIVDMLRGEASTINMDTIVRRFRRNLEHMYQLIASMILEIREELSDDLLEFVVNNIGDAALAYAPRLYSEIVKRGKTDLLDRLRSAWNRAWVTRKYPVLPVRCPVCGFNALMPDLSCLVCGSTVSERQLKESIEFDKLLLEYAKLNPRDVVETTIRYGYVYVTSYGLKPPTEKRDPLDIEVVLTSSEKEMLKKVIEEHGESTQ